MEKVGNIKIAIVLEVMKILSWSDLAQLKTRSIHRETDHLNLSDRNFARNHLPATIEHIQS